TLAHRCAILADGTVDCWSFGQTMTAQPVVGLTGAAVAISDSNPTTGSQEVCVVIADGSVECQGENSSGQLGDGTTTSSGSFVKVLGLPTTAASVGVGLGYACAALTNGQVWCWGENNELLDLNSHTPIQVPLAPL